MQGSCTVDLQLVVHDPCPYLLPSHYVQGKDQFGTDIRDLEILWHVIAEHRLAVLLPEYSTFLVKSSSLGSTLPGTYLLQTDYS